MANKGGDTKIGGIGRWRVLGWSGAAFLLLLPLIANAPWTASDYVFAAVLIGGVGGLFELAVRNSRSPAHRAAVGVALAGAFLTIWVNAAVGMIGDGDNPLNLMFAGVLALALLGALIARFRAEGMARATTLAAIAQLVAGGIGTLSDVRGGVLSATFALLWLLAAMLFGKAARDDIAAGI